MQHADSTMGTRRPLIAAGAAAGFLASATSVGLVIQEVAEGMAMDETVTGQVTSATFQEGSFNGKIDTADRCDLIATYTVDGLNRTAQGSTEGACPTGDPATVSVSYNPADPASAAVAGPNHTDAPVVIFLGTLPVLFCSIALYRTLRYWPQERRQRAQQHSHDAGALNTAHTDA